MSDSNMLTVSFGTWMELPNLKMYDWKPSLIDNAETRVTVATVAQYYQDYVRYRFISLFATIQLNALPQIPFKLKMLYGSQKLLTLVTSFMYDPSLSIIVVYE